MSSKPQPGVWGIDLGQCALKALRLELQDGQVTATAFDYVEHPKILSQPDADPDQLTREALEKFLSRNSLRGDLVAISVPGQSGLARFVKLPPVEEKKIADIVRFEAKQQIPFNLDEVVWDYQKIAAGVVTEGFAMETEIGLFAMKRDMVNRYLQHFKDVNVEVHIVQMAPLCLCNYVAYDLLNVGAEPSAEPGGRKKALVALDIGTDSSNLVVTDGQRIIWQRPIPLGGNHFTRALTKDLKLTFAKAEHLKRNASKSPDLKKILMALKPVLNDFVGEVQRSLGYFTNTHRDAQIEYLMGLGNAFRLPGLQKFLAEKLQLDVRKLGKLERLTGEGVVTAPAFTENVLSFAVAYGLALQGLQVARLTTNLLPPEIHMARLIRAKKPWAVAAAAALLAGTFFGPYLGYALEFKGVNCEVPPLKGAIDESDGVHKTFTSKKSDFDKAKKEAEDEEAAVKSIIAGQDERMNWVLFNKFLSDAIPRPDGSNLTPRAYQEFFINRGKAAYERYLKRRAEAARAGAVDEGDIDPYLVQYNIVALDARYADDLAAVYNRLTSGSGAPVNKNDIRPRKQAEVPPKEDGDKKGGWVVELRGYTHHANSRRFVLDGLVESLAAAAVKYPLQTAAPGAAAGAAPTAGAAPAAGGTGGAAPAASDAFPASEPKEPVINRVSHVMIYKTTTPEDPGNLIGSSVVASLLGGSGGGGMMAPGGGGDAAAGGGAMPPGGGAMPPGGGAMPPGGGTMPLGGGATGGSVASSSRRGFKSLLSGGAGGGPMPGMAGLMPGMAGLMPGMAGMPGGGKSGMLMPGATTPGGAGMIPGALTPGGGAGTKPAATQGPPRTEFVILFFWRENAPSDPPAPEGGGAAPAGGMMPGMNPPGGGMMPGMNPPGGGGAQPPGM